MEVTRLATGRWILIVGDDDEFDPATFGTLLTFLRTAEEGLWVLVGVRNDTGMGYLRDLRPGPHSAPGFRRAMLRTGLSPFGFIGMHVFPAALRPQFLALSLEDAQPWPHLALFLRHLAAGPVHVFPIPVVNQAAGGKELFWHQGDWARINLMKLNIVAGARRAVNSYRWFSDTLILRELDSVTNLRALLSWKTYEPVDFQSTALAECMARYRLLGPMALLTAPHCTVLLVAYCTPVGVLRLLLRLTGRGGMVSRYVDRKTSLGRFDGVRRGL
jgi:hypothetical protein